MIRSRLLAAVPLCLLQPCAAPAEAPLTCDEVSVLLAEASGSIERLDNVVRALEEQLQSLEARATRPDADAGLQTLIEEVTITRRRLVSSRTRIEEQIKSLELYVETRC